MKKAVKLDAEMYKGKKNAYIYMVAINYKDGHRMVEPHATKEGAISSMNIMFCNNEVIKHISNNEDCLYNMMGSVLDHDRVSYYTIESHLLFS